MACYNQVEGDTKKNQLTLDLNGRDANGVYLMIFLCSEGRGVPPGLLQRQ